MGWKYGRVMNVSILCYRYMCTCVHVSTHLKECARVVKLRGRLGRRRVRVGVDEKPFSRIWIEYVCHHTTLTLNNMFVLISIRMKKNFILYKQWNITKVKFSSINGGNFCSWKTSLLKFRNFFHAPTLHLYHIFIYIVYTFEVCFTGYTCAVHCWLNVTAYISILYVHVCECVCVFV